MDGSGSPSYTADVAVFGDEIALIGDLSGYECKNEVDAAGLCLAPGFIDLHTHSDGIVLVDGEMQSHIRQGVTTVGMGMCGGSAAPRTEKMEIYENQMFVQKVTLTQKELEKSNWKYTFSP